MQEKRPKKGQRKTKEVTYKITRVNEPSPEAIKASSDLIYRYILEGKLIIP